MSNEIEQPPLQPPNWSPTGNSGCWVWDEKGETNITAKGVKGKPRPCWKWYDDVYGYAEPPNPILCNRKSEKKSWIKKILGL